MHSTWTARWVLRTLGCLSLLLSLAFVKSGCTRSHDGSSDARTNDVEVPPSGTVRYRYVWNTEGITQLSGNEVWSVQTDLGYEVTIMPSFIVSASIQLTPCEEEASALTRIWNALFSMPAARAGHSSEYNPAAVTQGIVERLNALQNVEAGSVNGLSGEFCSVHYLVAAGDKETRNLPDTIQMVDRSMYIEGTWRAEGSTEAVPFVVDTALAWGLLKKLYPPAMYQAESQAFVFDSSVQGAIVTVNRRAGSLFDGVDFANLSPNTLPTRVLSAIFDATEISVETRTLAN